MKALYPVLFLTLALLISFQARAYSIKNIKVGGEKQAEVLFELPGNEAPLPLLKTEDNVVELTFPGAEIDPGQRDKFELNAPHTLIRRIAGFSPEKNLVKVRIVLNGSVEDLKHRLHVVKDSAGVKLTVDFPQGEQAAMNLFKDEQIPLSTAAAGTHVEASHSSRAPLAILCVVLVLAGVAAYFFARFMKKQTGVRGSRKYLIEQLSYCPMGQKAGVSLLKVGSEFILVGVTPTQVSLISSLPKLEEQYESESSLERTAFKAAVEDEYRRMKVNTRVHS